MHISSKNQNTKRRVEIKNILYFRFLIKKRQVPWVKMAVTLASHIVIVVCVVVVVSVSRVVFHSEHAKNDS